LDEWTVQVHSGGGPANPPLPNGSFAVTTTHGSAYAGAVVSWGKTDFTLGQVITSTRLHPQSTSAAWSLSGHAHLHSRRFEVEHPENVHQIWEIGWNNNGSVPAGLNACDQYQMVLHLTGADTGNHPNNFVPFEASGTIEG